MATFKKFAGNKPLDVIKAQCQAQGVEFIDDAFRQGDDHVTLRSPGAYVIFNTFNGRFLGRTPDGTQFFSDEPLDGTPWFDALLEFFYAGSAA